LAQLDLNLRAKRKGGPAGAIFLRFVTGTRRQSEKIQLSPDMRKNRDPGG
jgi:hypothetical protein